MGILFAGVILYYAVFLIYFVIALIWSEMNNDSADSRGISEYVSPDNQYKAILYTGMGGGGISPYCYSVVDVVKIDFSKKNKEKKYNVYSADCQTEILDNTKIHWLSNDELEITFLRADSFSPRSYDKKIKIIQKKYDENQSKN